MKGARYEAPYIEPYLRRKRRRTDWGFIWRFLLGLVLISAAVFVLLMDMGMLRADRAQAAGIIREGALLTPETFCARFAR